MKRRKSPVKSKHSQEIGQFRIIAGTWRSRKLSFPAVDGLRPTPDRVRETLFNWLPNLHNMAVLDAFAGSGSLGFEALSRGAIHCNFIDANHKACTALQNNASLLDCSQATVMQGQQPETLEQLTDTFDLIFLDPPYALDCLEKCLSIIEEKSLLNTNGWLYIENSSHAAPVLPANMQLHREKTYGQVRASLWQKIEPTS